MFVCCFSENSCLIRTPYFCTINCWFPHLEVEQSLLWSFKIHQQINYVFWYRACVANIKVLLHRNFIVLHHLQNFPHKWNIYIDICSKSRGIRLRGFNLWILVTGEPSVEIFFRGKTPVLQRQDYHEDYGDWVWKWPQVKEAAFGNNRAEEMGGGFKYFGYFHPENWGRFPFWRIFFNFQRGWNHQLGTDSLLQNSSISGIFEAVFQKCH